VLAANKDAISISGLDTHFPKQRKRSSDIQSPNWPTKLKFTTAPPKASRGPHNEPAEARMRLWPHAPPENAMGLSRLPLAQLRRRMLKRQIRNERSDRAPAVRDSHAHATPYPVHGYPGPSDSTAKDTTLSPSTGANNEFRSVFDDCKKHESYQKSYCIHKNQLR
jgi:hypothetical protein